jgi:hypothetical protein
MNNTFRESEDKRFDEEFYDSNLGYVTLHDTGAETVKSFLHDSQRRLVEKCIEMIETLKIEEAPPFSANPEFREKAKLINKMLMPEVKKQLISIINQTLK